jgi:VanZ family protein
MKEWIWRYGPAIVVMGLIFAASAMPGYDLPELGTWDVIAKKGGHMLGYALLSISYFHVINNGKRIRGLQFFSAVILAILYSITDEVHQLFTPGRNASPIDVCVDATGGFLGLGLWCFIRTRFWDRRKPVE